MKSRGGTVQTYIASFPPKTRKVLRTLRSLIKSTARGVTERISYGIPTFDFRGKRMVYIAGWASHTAMYPVTAGVTRALKREIKRYQSGKGTLKFPLEERLPVQLIRRAVRARMQEVERLVG